MDNSHLEIVEQVSPVLRVARTITDLNRATTVSDRHIAEALGYRVLDRASYEEQGAWQTLEKPSQATVPPCSIDEREHLNRTGDGFRSRGPNRSGLE